jgi:periplasmic divalent cation tolerance protein
MPYHLPMTAPLPPEMPAITLVTTTVATADDARRLARAVLEQRLAACVQVQAMASHYRWQGALHEEAEWRLECKTTPQAVAALLALLHFQHPYELPELVVQPLQASQAYAQWVAQEVAQAVAPQAAPG